MKGIEQARKFYTEVGIKMIADEFGDYQNRIAVGLVGHGSECFGFDDEVSRDHDFEVGFCMWLTKEDEEKIGSCALKAAQSGQYNYARCIKHGEDGAAMLALCEFVKNACELAFLLEKKHMPYYKWAFRQMRTLDKFAELSMPLEFLLTADNDEKGKELKREIVEDACGAFAKEINEQFDLGVEGRYLEPFGYAIQKRIKNAEIRNLHVIL